MSNEDGVSFEPSLFLRELTSFGQRVECVRTEVELQLTSTQ